MNNKIFYNDAALFALKTNFEYNEFNNLKNNNNNNLEVDESKKSLPKLKHMKKNENKPESDLQTNPTLNEKMKDEKSVKTEEISPITRNPIVEKVEPKKKKRVFTRNLMVCYSVNCGSYLETKECDQENDGFYQSKH